LSINGKGRDLQTGIRSTADEHRGHLGWARITRPYWEGKFPLSADLFVALYS